MKRVIVIGCPGAGKSVFSRSLHEKTGLPLFYLDMMYWNADKTKVLPEVFQSRLSGALAEERWIIDGNYLSTMRTRMEACDTVIFLDYEASVCLEGVKARRGKKRPDMPWIEEEEDAEFISYIRHFEETARPKILALLEEYRERRKILVFHDRTEASRFLA